jgi:hypothetical protein
MWIEAVRRIMDNPPIRAIIGNKCNRTTQNENISYCKSISGDLEHQRAVRLDKTKHFVQDYRLYNFLISAKTGEAVCILVLSVTVKIRR